MLWTCILASCATGFCVTVGEMSRCYLRCGLSCDRSAKGRDQARWFLPRSWILSLLKFGTVAGLVAGG